jgi:hypothetical protein
VEAQSASLSFIKNENDVRTFVRIEIISILLDPSILSSVRPVLFDFTIIQGTEDAMWNTNIQRTDGKQPFLRYNLFS